MSFSINAINYTLSRLSDEAFKTRSNTGISRAGCLFTNADGDQYELSLEYSSGDHCVCIKPYPTGKSFITARQQAWTAAHRTYAHLSSDNATGDRFDISRQAVTSHDHVFEEFCNTLRDRMQIFMNTRLCSCLRNIIVDEHDMCFDCGLKLSEEAFDKHLCAICIESGLSPVVQMVCCHQYLHTKCLEEALKVDSRCPLCRAVAGPSSPEANSVQDSW